MLKDLLDGRVKPETVVDSRKLLNVTKKEQQHSGSEALYQCLCAKSAIQDVR